MASSNAASSNAGAGAPHADDEPDAPLPDPRDFVGPLTAADHAEVLECARHGEAANLAYLLAIGCDVDTRDAGGSTALHKAAANGLVPILEMLGGAGARFVANASGNTPLHFACLTGQREAAAWLLRHFGAAVDVFAKNAVGKSAFTEAAAAGHEDLARLLLEHSSADPARGGGGSGGGGGGGGGSGGGSNAAAGGAAAATAAVGAAAAAADAGEDDGFGDDGEAEDVGDEDEDLVDEARAEAAGSQGGGDGSA